MTTPADSVPALLTPDAARCILVHLDDGTLDPHDTLSSTEVRSLRTLCAEAIATDESGKVTEPCVLCVGPDRPVATNVIVDNYLRDDRTIEVWGGPLLLDDGGPSQVGATICDHHAMFAREIGYGVERKEAS